MKVDLLLAPGSETRDLVNAAGAAGIDTLWWVDSPAVFGDPFVAMGVAATVDDRMNYGLAVINPLSRDLLMAASSISSIRVLTSRRVLLGVGVGHTGTSAFALPKASLAQLERFVYGLREVLAGGDFVREDGKVERIVNPVRPWFDVKAPVGIFVAAGGPKGLPLAGRIADGALVGGLADTAVITRARELVAGGAESAGRNPASVEICVTPSLAVSRDVISGGALRDLLGPKSLGPALTFRQMCADVYGPEAEIVQQLTAIETAYRTFGTAVQDSSSTHAERLKGYMTELEDWQRPLVTSALLDLTSIYGTVEECAASMRRLAAAGVDRLIISPSPQHVVEALSLLTETITDMNSVGS